MARKQPVSFMLHGFILPWGFTPILRTVELRVNPSIEAFPVVGVFSDCSVRLQRKWDILAFKLRDGWSRCSSG